MRNRQVIGQGRTAEILAWKSNQVLKLFRSKWALSAVRQEEKAARIASEAGLPVPAVYGIVRVGWRHGIIYERIQGSSMLKELLSRPRKLEHFAGLFAELHAEMHSITIEELPSQHQRIKKKFAMPNH